MTSADTTEQYWEIPGLPATIAAYVLGEAVTAALMAAGYSRHDALYCTADSDGSVVSLDTRAQAVCPDANPEYTADREWNILDAAIDAVRDRAHTFGLYQEAVTITRASAVPCREADHVTVELFRLVQAAADVTAVRPDARGGPVGALMAKRLGQVLWQVSVLASHHSLDLATIAADSLAARNGGRP
jgi:hypothetical protein